MAPHVVASVLLLVLLPLIASGARRLVAWWSASVFLILLGVASAAPEWSALQSAPVSFLAVSAGFVWLGLALIVQGYRDQVRAKEATRLFQWNPFAERVAFSITSAMLALFVYQAWPLLSIAGWRGPVAALGLGGSGVVLAFAFRWLKVSERIQRLDDRWLARDHAPALALAAQAELFTWIALLAALLLVLFTHTLFAFSCGAFAVVIATHRLLRQQGKSAPFPLRPILAAASLLGFYFAVRTIAGSEIPLHFPGILETPFSVAAEAALALVVGLGAWVMIGLWPFHGAGAGSAAAVVGGAFLIRWGNGLIPDGMMHAAPIFALVAMVAALHAAATGRVGEYAGALGVLAVTAQHRAAWAFFGLATCLAVVRLVPKEALRATLCPPGLDRRQFGAILLIPVLAVALPWMLRGEAFQTAVAMLAGIPLVLSMRK